MNKISELKRILGDNFSWNKARLDCFVRLLLAMFAVRTVNLSEMAVGFISTATVASRYKRLRRFFSQFKLDYSKIAIWIFKLFVTDRKVVLTAAQLFNRLRPKEQPVFPMAIELFGAKVYLSGSRSERGELMIVATNQPPQNAIALYLRRWEIETLFSCLKGRGFRFEETHITYLDRIEKRMAVLAIGCCWAHKTGEWRAIQKAIPFKQYAGGLRRPFQSFFRYGFDFIREIILSPFNKGADFKRCLAALSPYSSA